MSGDDPQRDARDSGAVAALRYRNFRLLWGGLVVTSIGSWMMQFGLGWLTVDLAVRAGTPSLGPLFLGLAGLARVIPGVLFGLAAGVIADRMDRRLVLAFSQALGAVVAALLAVLVLTDQITIVWVMVGSALASTSNAFDVPTRQAFMPRLVPPRAFMSALGLVSSAITASMLLGPLVGGLLIGPIGVGGIMVVNAASYLPILAAIAALPRIAPAPGAARASILRSLGEGLGYVRREPAVRMTLVLVGSATVFGRAVQGVLPAVANDPLHVGAVELSWLMGASGAGALVGSLTVTMLGGVRRRGILLTAMLMIEGAIVVLFALQRDVLPAALLIAPFSACSMVLVGMSNAISQTRPPDRLRARVLSVHVLIVQSGLPLGTLVVGSLMTVVGSTPALALAGATVAIVGAAALLREPAIREYDSTTPQGPAAERAGIA